MTEDEIDQLLRKLEELLKELGLGFVVEQERVLAAEGVSKSGADLSFPVSLEQQRYEQLEAPLQIRQFPGRPPKFNSDDVRVTPLDVRARLGLLLDLIEVATAGTLAMERSVHTEIKTLRDLAESRWAESWNGTVTFANPPEAEWRGETQEPWTLVVGAPYDRSAAHAANVVSLVESLREQADVPRGAWLTRVGVDGADGVWVPTKGES